MTIWILAFVLFICLSLVGYNQGAIRVTLSLFGLIISSLLALPLSPVVQLVIRPLLGLFGVKNPVVLWAIAPLIAFLILLTIFKAVAFGVHRQLEIYYKYKAGELRFALWERLNKRIGACLGVINAFIYLLLITVVIYVIGYWTVQMAHGENDPRSIRLVNQLVKDLHSTGLDKTTRSLDPMEEVYYVAGDIVGIVYHNPLANSRLSRYPTLLALSERTEFAELSNDTTYLEMLQRRPPINEILRHPKTRAIMEKPGLLKEIWGLLKPDLKDLRDFMLLGKSAKYDGEPILGRWTYDPAASVSALKLSKTNMSVIQMKELRKLLTHAYSKSSFVATPTHQALLKDVIWLKPGVKVTDNSTNPTNRSGIWQGGENGYKISLAENKEMTANIDGGKLKLTGDWTPLIFSKEE